MVSFNCDTCGDVLTKVRFSLWWDFFLIVGKKKQGKIKNHALRCRIRKLSCLDCSTDFAYPSPELDAHTSCISEADKYGHTKKKRKQNGNQQKQPQQQQHQPQQPPKETSPEKKVEDKKSPAKEIVTKEQLKEAKRALKEAKKTYKALKKKLKTGE
jgi:hypothetical protein